MSKFKNLNNVLCVSEKFKIAILDTDIWKKFGDLKF